MKRAFLFLLLFFFPLVGKSENCSEVATVFNEKICYSHIEYKPYSFKPDAKVKYEQEKNNLYAVVWNKGINNLLEKGLITPKKEEIEAEMEYKDLLHKSQEEWQLKLNQFLKDLLTTHNYTEKNKSRIIKSIKSSEEVLKLKQQDKKSLELAVNDMEKRAGKKRAEEMRKKLLEHREELPRKLATGFVKQWKIKKAIYDKYGGRVIFQQFGPEPIDAYQKLLEAIKTKGKLTINKSKFSDFYSQNEKYNKSEAHTFLPLKESAEYFLNPPWKNDPNATTKTYFQRAMKDYARIPHL